MTENCKDLLENFIHWGISSDRLSVALLLGSALLATMRLFRSLAVEIANKLNYLYPKKADEYASAWVMSVL